MARTPTGTITSVATALATAKTITAISNAASAVCTSVAHGYATNDKVSGISRHHRQAMLGRRRCDEDIRVAEGMPGLSTGLDDETPLQQDVLRNGQHPVREHGPEAMIQPMMVEEPIAASVAGNRNTPEPIMLPATSMVASMGPMRRAARRTCAVRGRGRGRHSSTRRWSWPDGASSRR
jgi:hypothetical protein